MRYIIIFLIFFFSSALSANAMEVLLGRISSVNSDTGEIVLNLKNFNEKSGTENKKNKCIKISFKKKDLPSGIHKGSLIRVWGNLYDDKSLKYFDAKKIVPMGKITINDPTGVRQRLRHGRHMGGEGSGGRHGRHNNR